MTRGATPERLELATRAIELRAAGLLVREVAERLNISKSYVSDLVGDPDGSRSRRRKDSYSGTCEECGSPTSGANGPDNTPRWCIDCARRHKTEGRTWTPKAVVDAIHRFANIHGRPPTADEWRRTDGSGNFPATSTIHRSGGGRNPPFPSWGSAIEAAGYERPTTGRRRRHEMSNPRKGYIILQETEPGHWLEVGQSDANNQTKALNEVLAKSEPVGRWVAIPGGYWEPRSLRPTTVYEFVSE